MLTHAAAKSASGLLLQAPLKRFDLLSRLTSLVYSRKSLAKKNNDKITIEIPTLNKRLSLVKHFHTALDAISQFSEHVAINSGLAILDSTTLINVNEALETSGSLGFLQFKDAKFDPTILNHSFWHGCAFILAATLESSFKEAYDISLTSIPPDHVESGAFSVEFSTSKELPAMSLKNLQALSIVAKQIAALKLSLIPVKLNEIETKQLNAPASQFVLLSNKFVYPLESDSPPVFNNTCLINRFAVTKIVSLGRDQNSQRFIYKALGVALPNAFAIHHSIFDRLACASMS